MNGASNRRRGNRFEVAVANHLSEQLGVDVITTRNGRHGAQGGTDLMSADDSGRFWPHVACWAVECKDVAGTSVPSWLAQAAEDAASWDVDWWMVVHKQRYKAVGDAAVHVPRGMLADYLEHGAPRGPYSPADHVSLSLDAWIEVIR